ncbi:MAG: histidine triad nucleotide-binding protein [Rhodocyclaceae bacterium]|jgi:histidine triad (HIT) family protein|nr:histidine triad nucleotide-binding protein [Rhodocyclaceae bacterium]MBK6555350.1 histidine triad nucleotide-binding protein [Rhodocyclaceae bacterium]MBK6676743.1 histidine triad nucleotide-binding protein [Rhodocyclaceae bacterium]MBK7815630.1 histidine triad nucleotide-binding protein [Rhodocyclaceae bacterium]MBK9309367.1 histidine triad nucleotide-binding protein [Rhodocyclaceae bacterium]
MSDCIFCKIARGEIPSKKVYEDEDLFAFHDIHPQAPVHFMIIPKQHIASLNDTDARHQAVLGKLFAKAGEMARSQGLADGFRTIINTGRVGRQEVYHLHVHILGGPEPLGAMLPRS